MIKKEILCLNLILFLLLPTCAQKTQPKNQASFVAPSTIPESLITKMNNQKEPFFKELFALLEQDSYNLFLLADKKTFLDATYEPSDLVALSSQKTYRPSKNNMLLRKPAEQALETLAKAALKDGVTLVVSSTYRSYDYQKTVYERNVRELGQMAADRESARPGTSQHQLGTVVDFGSITDEFAETKAGKWLSLHAGEYGWSLSFPEGYESVTGYRWECWHYRYIGIEGVNFQNKWFDGIQQYMLEFIHAWKNSQE